MFKQITDFYQNNKQKINIIAIAIVVLICIVSIKSCVNNKTTVKNLKIANDSLNMKIVEYVDKNKITHARVMELELSKSELNSLNENLKNHYIKKVDSLANILNVKNKEIQSYLTIIAKSTGSGIGKIDTVYEPSKNALIVDTSYRIYSNDGFLSYNGLLKNGGLSYNYDYTMMLSAVRLKKNKGFLGLNKEYYWDISTNNPNAKIIGLEQFTTNPVSKLKRFSVVVGPSFGIDNKFKFSIQPISVTVGIKLFDF